MLVVQAVKAGLVRLALVVHSAVTCWRVTVNLDDDMYWILMITVIPLLAESYFTIVKRKGIDFKWVTPCFFFYLLATMPSIWLLEMDKTKNYQDETDEANQTTQELLDIDLNPTTWTILIEELLLYLLIVGRWVLPRGEVTREQLSELLFAFIGIASDIIEMFSLFGEKPVRESRRMSLALLGVWSLSIFQFCLTVTVTHQPKRSRKIMTVNDNVDEDIQKKMSRNQIIAIFVSMCMHDLPFLVLRLYTIIEYDLVTYNLVFFTAKNVLVICLLLYKVVILCFKSHCPHVLEGAEMKAKRKKDADEEVVVGENGLISMETAKTNGQVAAGDTSTAQADSKDDKSDATNRKKKKRQPKYTPSPKGMRQTYDNAKPREREENLQGNKNGGKLKEPSKRGRNRFSDAETSFANAGVEFDGLGSPNRSPIGPGGSNAVNGGVPSTATRNKGDPGRDGPKKSAVHQEAPGLNRPVKPSQVDSRGNSRSSVPPRPGPHVTTFSINTK